MAIEKVVNIVANTKQAVADVKKLFDELLDAEQQQQALNESAEEMEDAYKKSSKEATKDIEKVGDSAKKQSKVVQGLKKSVQAVGKALKALGIGLVIALVAKFTQVLSENQKVVDFVSGVSNTLGIIINQLVESFIKIGEKISEATGGFDALGRVIGAMLKGAFSNLKIAINGLRLGFEELKLAYEKVFGDEQGVKKAEENIKGLKKAIAENVEESAKQAKVIYDNIGEAVGEVVTGVTTLAKGGVEAISEIDVKSAYAQGQAIARNKKNFELLALQQQRIQLLYQFQAESLRQVRDDDTKSIAERIKANEELSEVLKKQFEAESATINARISALSQEQKLLGFTQERQNEIYQLQTDLIDVAERLKGVESEQLSNKNALLREQLDLQQTIYDNENERQLAQLDFEAEIAQTEDDRLNKLRERYELEQQLALEDLERKRELYAEGTQSRVDAEQEYLNRKQEIDNEIKKNNLDLYRLAEENYDKELERKKFLEEQKVSLTADTFGQIANILGEASTAGKAFASAQALINTYQGVTEIWANKTTLPEPFGTINKVASTATALLSGLSAVKQINSTKTLGGGGGSTTASAPQAPSFNLVAGTGTNQIAESLATERQPVKAYVVASEMTNQQALENNISSTASIG